MDREAIEKLLSELGFSGKDLDITADAVELHKAGMPMMELYRLVGRTLGAGPYTVLEKLHEAITHTWKKRIEAMERLFEIYLLCRPSKNRTFLLRVEQHLKKEAPASAVTDASAKKKD